MYIHTENQRSVFILQCDKCKKVKNKVLEIHRLDIHKNKTFTILAKDLFHKKICIECLNEVLTEDHKGTKNGLPTSITKK